jgi:uncharacterized DUF497 family protein
VIVAARDDLLDNCTGFDWDDANVTPEEAEDIFFNDPLVVRDDVRHSRREKRYYALGQTGRGRLLFVSFTIRRELIRVISVQEFYGRHEETNA